MTQDTKREALRAILLPVEDFINEPPRRYDIEPMEVRDYRHEAYRVWSKCRDQIMALPTHPTPTAEQGGWMPRIGDRVEMTDACPDAPLWRQSTWWVAGLRVADNGNGIDVTVTEQWPVPMRHSRGFCGHTDGFFIGRPGEPDQLRPATLTKSNGDPA